MPLSKSAKELVEKIDRPVYYLGRKYLIVQADNMNVAILERRKVTDGSNISKATKGHFPSIETALIELIRLKNRDDLMKQISESGPFTKLEELVKTFVIGTLKHTQTALDELKENYR